MGAEKFPLASEIPWDKIKEVKVTADAENYSFEFEVQGKKQRITIGITPDSTSFTLSGQGGKPLVHATQKGGEVSVVDFAVKPALPGWVKRLQKKSG